MLGITNEFVETLPYLYVKDGRIAYAMAAERTSWSKADLRPPPYPRQVDISTFRIRADQLHAEFLADVHAFKTAFQSAFNGRMPYLGKRTKPGGEFPGSSNFKSHPGNCGRAACTSMLSTRQFLLGKRTIETSQ